MPARILPSALLVTAALLAAAVAWGEHRVDTSHGHSKPIVVRPDRDLMDVPPTIEIGGIRPHARAVVSASAFDGDGSLWEAESSLVADAHGRATIIDASSLIASMQSESRSRRFSFAWEQPLIFRFRLQVDGRTVGEDSVVRFVRSPEVVVRPVREDSLVGVFFSTPRVGGGGILVIGGSEGGLSGADVAAVLASRGFATLALAYFQDTGLPRALENIPLEYFERAISWLSHQPGVRGRIAIVGTSKGAEAALLVAAHDSTIRAVVAYAPSAFVWSCICDDPGASSWSRDGTPVPFIPPGDDPAYTPKAGEPLRPAVNYRYQLSLGIGKGAARIPVENVRARLALISGEEDLMWPSSDMAQWIIAARRKAGRTDDLNLTYPHAGHLIGKLLLPAGSTRVAGGRLETGGEPAGNAAAQRDSWPRVLEFLRAVLR